MKRAYESSHPWLTFKLDLTRASHLFWLMLGECQSKIEHLAGTPLRPGAAKALHRIYLAKGVQATTAIEGNTLSEKEVRALIDHKLKLPPSRAYLQQEVENVIKACNRITRDVIEDDVAVLTPMRLMDFNKEVLNGLRVDEGVVPGVISTFDVGVPGYRGAPRRDCEFLLQRLCAWLSEEEFRPTGELRFGMALVRAILAHLYLAWIHPFGDGNGRTARLMEFQILLEAGIPTPAAHLLSNHYNQTRHEYYRQLDHASKSGGDVLPFLLYAVQGYRDGIRKQIARVRKIQRGVAWINFVHESFGETQTATEARRLRLVLDLTGRKAPVKLQRLTGLSARIAKLYARRGPKTLARDLAALKGKKLIRLVRKKDEQGRLRKGYVANTEVVLAFLPKRRPG